MKYLIYSLISLEVLDGAVTHWSVRRGLVQEGNPLMASIAGDWNFLILKAAGAALSAVVLWRLYQHFPRIALTVTSSIMVFYGVVLAWNSSILFNI
jgi:hypothetical protein